MQTTVAEAWGVLDLYARKSPFLVCCSNLSEYLDRKHLLDGLDCIVESVKAGCLHFHSILCDVEGICFMRHVGSKSEGESSTRLSFIYCALGACDNRKLLRESVDHSLCPFVGSGVISYVSAGNAELA